MLEEGSLTWFGTQVCRNYIKQRGANEHLQYILRARRRMCLRACVRCLACVRARRDFDGSIRSIGMSLGAYRQLTKQQGAVGKEGTG